MSFVGFKYKPLTPITAVYSSEAEVTAC